MCYHEMVLSLLKNNFICGHMFTYTHVHECCIHVNGFFKLFFSGWNNCTYLITFKKLEFGGLNLLRIFSNPHKVKMHNCIYPTNKCPLKKNKSQPEAFVNGYQKLLVETCSKA